MKAKILIISALLSFSSSSYSASDDDESYCSVKSTLTELLFKGTVHQAEKILGSCNAWYKYTSRVTTESTSDGHLVQIRIYGPDDPWLVIYSINNIIVKFKILGY